MALKTLPEILQLPPKLYPMIERFNDYRYFLIHGGRGGGKTHGVARWILFLCEKKRIRVLCGRETQNSIAESVYTVFADLIQKHQLDFEVMATKIICRTTGSTISFRGFREAGAFSIQGIESTSILWVDESQSISKRTLDILLPTIRGQKSKIYWTMNRHIELDPVYEAFSGRPDCLEIFINFSDNPYCSDALRNEAAECLKKSKSDYDHIWLGQPLLQAEDCLFSRVELMSLKKPEHRPGFDTRIAGFDVARYGDDKCACVILQQVSLLHWEVVHVEEWEKRDLNYTAGRIYQIHMDHWVARSIIDEDGIGSGTLDSLRHGRGLNNFSGFRNHSISYEDNKNYANPRTVNAYKLKDLVLNGHIYFDHPDLIKELCTLRYAYDNHQRKILISKDKMRRDGVKSPNLADSIVMAVSLISEVKQEQERSYGGGLRMPRYCAGYDTWNPFRDLGIP